MAKRYIDADAYIDYCDKNWLALNVDAVNAQPTVDLVDVVKKLSSWHTEDPEENREYFVTWQASLNGHTFRKIGIFEWDYDRWIIDDWIRESYKNISVVAWMPLPEPYKDSEEE